MKPTLDFKELKINWRRFVTNGTIADGVRKPIADSWLRCKDEGLEPQADNLAPSVNEEEYQRRYKNNRKLLDASLPFMIELQEFVKDMGYSTTLVDADGVILELICDEKILQQAFQKNLVTGSIWNEEMAGTNATGLAILLKKPIQVVGAEHYYKCYHELTCSAAPIFDENKVMVGAVDMAGPKEYAYPHTLGMVAAITASISREIQFRESDRKLELTNQYMNTLVNTLSDGVVAVDVNGKIIGINSQGAKILQTTTFDSYGKNILDIMEGEKVLDLRNEASDSIVERHVVSKSNRINCLVNRKLIYHENGDVVGAVATLKDMKRIEVASPKKKRKGTRFTFEDIIGVSSEVKKAIHLTQIAASGSATVLIQGESGTGKEMFVQAMHNETQADRPFVAVNCSAIPETLIESVLFGYEGGSFTGADRQGKKGKFEQAEGGTIFLDEIGEMPLTIQTVLLRVLQERYIQRVGGHRDIPVNARIVAATNRNLIAEVKKGKFREDLYYRLNVLTITIPPLRERMGDIEALSRYFIDMFSERYKKSILPLNELTLDILRHYDWPGNVRQFQNAIEQAIYFAEGSHIDEFFISDYLPSQNFSKELGSRDSDNALQNDTVDLKQNEIDTIRKALNLFPEKKKAATFLGISRSTLYRKIKEYNLDD